VPGGRSFFPAHAIPPRFNSFNLQDNKQLFPARERNKHHSFGIPEISKLEEIGQKKGDIPGKPDAVREIWKCVVLKIGHQGDQKWRYLF